MRELQKAGSRVPFPPRTDTLLLLYPKVPPTKPLSLIGISPVANPGEGCITEIEPPSMLPESAVEVRRC